MSNEVLNPTLGFRGSVNLQESVFMGTRDRVGNDDAIYLPQDEMPDNWYNILADLPAPLITVRVRRSVT